jgi:hypothetical protein
MLKINFYPESDKKEYIKAAKEYKVIWKNDGKTIVRLIEKYSGMNFKTKIINAVTSDNISFSIPMTLESNLNHDQKKGTLAHELLHRLLVDNNFWFKKNKNITEIVHKIIDLILFDIWTDLFGESKAKENINHEISYGCLDYKNAWEWALSFSKEDRKNKFKEMKLKYQKGPK